MEKKIWINVIVGRGQASKIFESETDATTEAERLSKQEGSRVYVCQSIKYIQPLQPQLETVPL